MARIGAPAVVATRSREQLAATVTGQHTRSLHVTLRSAPAAKTSYSTPLLLHPHAESDGCRGGALALREACLG